MSGESIKRVALSNQLESGEGFAGSRTAELFQSALRLAGVESLDAAEVLAPSVGDAAEHPDAWITLSSAASDPDGVAYCRSKSLPYYMIDPVLAETGSGETGSDVADSDVAKGQASCFTPKANRLSGERHHDQVWYIPPFLDPEPYFTAQRDAAAYRQNLSQRHHLPGDVRWIFLSVPADSVNDSLYSTFETLSRLYMFEWNLIVSATDETCGLAEQLLARLSGKSRCLLRPDDPTERQAFLAASDLFLTAERTGGMVFDILEALASGLAVVANKSPVIEEVVENGITGRLSAAGNPASLSNDLSFLLRNENFLQTYRGNTRGQVVARHDIMVAAQTLGDMIALDN